MADEQVPAKDIAAVFKRLKSLGENKMCFDCRASNPTWASITYGVFLCIDCSAVHRGLGVHLSFIRSIQLDTNWTWTQVRHMQVGGNAKANAFFKQHNLTTTDAKAKYNSRVANMYRERLASAVQKELQMNGTKLLHLDGHHGQNNPSTPEQKEVDFFERLEEEYDESNSPNTVRANKALDEDVNNGHIDVGHLAGSPPKKDSRMPTIGNRKPVNAKKKGLGAKKGGLGATKTSTNFKAIEAEAMNLDKSREQAENQRGDFASPAPPVDQPLSSALLYKTAAMKKEEEKLKNVDPKKAEQLERLGMGYGARSTFSHSVSDSMQSVEQVKPVRNSSQESFKDRGREASPSRGFFESYGSSDREGSGLTTEEPPRYDSSAFSMKSSWDEDLEGSRVMSKSNEKDDTSRSRAKKPAASEPSTSDEVQKKYGNAKAISSDQMFGSKDQHEMNRRLDQYSSSSGISSADLFGENKRAQSSSAVSVDYTAIKDSVQHVTGKLTNMASGVIGSLQSRYSGANR